MKKIACLLCTIFMLPSCQQPSSKPTEQTKISSANLGSTANDKKTLWQNMEKKVASWGDALGLGIDPGIKKMIIALNLLNFKTNQSCEGHTDHGRPYPWVSLTVTSPELNNLQDKRIKNLKFIQEQQEKIQKKYPKLSLGEALRKQESLGLTNPKLLEAYKESWSLNDEIEKTSRLAIIKLNNLLTDFYRKRHTDPDTMLFLSSFGFDSFELFSLGGNWQVTRSESEKLKKLQEYQAEMNLFADFLKDYYFKVARP